MPTPLMCPNCGVADNDPKPFQKFCSVECRKDYQRKKRSGTVPKVSEKIESSEATAVLPPTADHAVLTDSLNKPKCKNVMVFKVSSIEAKKLTARLEAAISRSRITGGVYTAGYWDGEKSQEVVFNIMK